MDRKWWSISNEVAHSLSFQSKHSQLWVVIFLCITCEHYCKCGIEIRSPEIKKQLAINWSHRRIHLLQSGTYLTGHCAHYHPAGIFYPQHTLTGDQVNLVTLHQQVKIPMAPQYVHWKLKPVSNLYQPGRNLEKINSTYFKLTRCFRFLLTIVFIKGLPIFLMKNRVLPSKIKGTLKDNFLPCLLVSYKQIWKCTMKFLLVVVCNLHIYETHHQHHPVLGQTLENGENSSQNLVNFISFSQVFKYFLQLHRVRYTLKRKESW